MEYNRNIYYIKFKVTKDSDGDSILVLSQNAYVIADDLEQAISAVTQKHTRVSTDFVFDVMILSVELVAQGYIDAKEYI